MGLVSLLVLFLGMTILLRLFFLHNSPLPTKRNPSHLKNHITLFLIGLSLIVIGVMGAVIVAIHSNQEITGKQYHHLVEESKELPHIKQRISSHINRYHHINKIEYCNLIHTINSNKAANVKKVIKAW